MNRALTASSLLAASLAFLPTASQAQSDVKFLNIMDSTAVEYELRAMFNLKGYDGPVVIAQTEKKEGSESGYIAMMNFSNDALGPIEQHPALELMNFKDLEGVPMFITDRIDSSLFQQNVELDIEADNIAGVVDLRWAAEDLFDELNDGIGEGDFLVVTHDLVEGEAPGSGVAADTVPSQEVYAANVYDPSPSKSEIIEEVAGLSYSETTALAVLLDPETKEVIAGFSDEVRVDWIQDSSTQNESDTQEPGTGNGDTQEPGTGNGSTDGEEQQEEESQREDVVDGRDIEIPSNLGGSMDLPKASVSPRGQFRHNARFAPVTR